jgi:hypothetical protein
MGQAEMADAVIVFSTSASEMQSVQVTPSSSKSAVTSVPA